MTSKYYYLVAGLPELSLEDNKLSYTVADFKTEFYPFLSPKDQQLVNLYYLKFDNANVLALLRQQEDAFDSRGCYSAAQLEEYIAALKEGDTLPDDLFPSYLSIFITEYFQQEAATQQQLPEDRLASLYYAYAMKCSNRFVAQWFEFNLTMNNVLVALAARKYKWDVAQCIVGDTAVCEALRNSTARDFGLSAELDYLDALMKIGDTEELVEKERKADLLRWKWMEENSCFCYFTVERLFVFLMQIEMIERWITLDKEKGNQMFRQLISTLKDQVQIPAEFR